MPSIYEALMRASEEREALKSKGSMPGSKGAGAAHLPYRMEDEMLVLLEAIESILPRSRKRAIQFIGSQTGQGASNMAREYARFSASATGPSVHPRMLLAGIQSFKAYGFPPGACGNGD